MIKYVAFTDGGCYTRKDNTSTPSYFSFQVWQSQTLQYFYQYGDKNKPLYAINRFYLRSLIPEYYQRARDREKRELGHTTIDIVNDSSLFVPANCSIFNTDGHETNNTAEYAAVYFCLAKIFSLIQSGPQIEIFSGSQLIVNQVNGLYRCEQDHLKPWLAATNKLKNQMNVVLKWTERENIVRILGH